MATKRQSTSPTASPPNTTAAAKTDPADDPMPVVGVKAPTKEYAQPIGRPGTSQFVTDPTTGEVILDSQGNPIPWQATRPFTVPQRFGVEDAGPTSYGVMPKYYEGAVEEILGNMPPELLAQLQAHMVDARVYGSKNPNIVYGIPDQETMSAFRAVLTQANNTGYDYQTVIQNWGRIAQSAPPAPPTPHITQVTNTDDLLAVFKTASRSALGRELSDSEARQYAATFQAQERGYQGTQYAAADAGQSASVMAPPSPSNFLDAQVQQNNPSEYGANRFANTFDAFQQLLRGPAG